MARKLKEQSGFVPLHGIHALSRRTPIAITLTTRMREVAEAFMGFLKSSDGHRIFRKFGSSMGTRLKVVRPGRVLSQPELFKAQNKFEG